MWRVSPRSSRVSSRQVSADGAAGALQGEVDVPRGPLLRGSSRSSSPHPLTGGVLPSLRRHASDVRP